MIIAVDGPAASGKGTLARQLAAHFNLAYLDTGALYRAVGLTVLRNNDDPTDIAVAEKAARNLSFESFDDPALRDEATGAAASKVAAILGVRGALLEFQRSFSIHPPGQKRGVVLDGRDIGTVVFPETPYKIFLVADVEIRARRRVKELRARGVKAIHNAVLQDMSDRDAFDKSRGISPLVPARDAFVLDTSELDADAVFAAALDSINSTSEAS